MSRELWQLLIDMNKNEPTPLTPSECFALLEFMADLQAEMDSRPDSWSPTLHRCLDCVPTCRAELLAMLNALISSNAQQT